MILNTYVLITQNITRCLLLARKSKKSWANSHRFWMQRGDSKKSNFSTEKVWFSELWTTL